MRKDSNIHDEMKFLNHTIPTFKGPIQHATWIHDTRMNVKEKFKIRIVQISFCSELGTCESEELKQRERGQCHDFLHEIITYYKNNQVNGCNILLV